MPLDPDATWLSRPVAEVVSSPDFYLPFSASVVASFAWYLAARKMLLPYIYGSISTASEQQLQKAKAWVTTLFSSVILVLGGLPMAMEFLLLDKDQTTADMTLRDSRYAWGLGAFLAGFLAADSVLGCVSYPTQFGLLTGWVHHVGYVGVIVWLTCAGQIGIFMSFVSVAEISTILLSLGSVNPKLRTDLGFGISFFLCRILFHTALVLYAMKTYSGYFWVAPAIPLPIHCHWFYSWCKKYFSRQPRPKSD
ncbi:hypothetical protein HDU84_007538 [Entophlyctis sp. JEL0112]|nr:hypothetical protein HDU84_007538 [Entophlyctis sp. JEL0112]